MIRPVWTPTEITQAMNSQAPGVQSLSDLLGLIAQSVQADAIQLGIDQGTGYRRDYFIKQTAGAEFLSDASHPPFVITRETRVQRDPSPSGLVASPEWMDQYTLSIGTAGRRNAPRSGIALLRSPTRPIFKPGERRQLAFLLPHLNTAIALAFELERARHQEAYAHAMLEEADDGLLLVSPQGMPLHGNQLAYALLEQAHIKLDPHRLLMPNRGLQSKFDIALAHAAAPSGESTTFLIPGLSPIVLVLRPTYPDMPSGFAPAKTLTLILRGAQSATRLPDCVAQHFQLTPAEFKLCEALVEGASLKRCAQNWGRSYDTLRSQLKSILAKTETHRQTELITLLNIFRTR
ncbi:MAG TPA: hypothetical protein VIN38_01535 [Thiobacillus sp.]